MSADFTPGAEDARVSLFRSTALWTGADDALVEDALRSRQPRLVVSGRLAGGKDTVAEAAMSAFGCPAAVRVSFATALRREVDGVIDIVRSAPYDPADRDVISQVRVAGASSVAQAREVLALVRAALADDPCVNSSRRTPEVRRLLQIWGTEVRRAVDDSYWVKRSMREVVALLATGKAVYVTDARFPNEVEAARALGFLSVRLEVAFAVRAERLRLRDGLEIDPAAENHPSEKELENYPGFDLWVDNSGPLDASVSLVVAELGRRFPAHDDSRPVARAR